MNGYARHKHEATALLVIVDIKLSLRYTEIMVVIDTAGN